MDVEVASNPSSAASDDDFEGEELTDFDVSNLKEKDPEFYQYLLENDKSLLEFEDSGDDGPGEDQEDEDNEGDDDDDDDDGESSSRGRMVTQKYIDQISKRLTESGKKSDIAAAVKLFKTTIQDASGENTGKLTSQSSEIFGSVVRLCLIDLLPAIHKFLKLKPPHEESKSINPSTSRHWPKLVAPLKVYLTSVVKILDVVSEPSVIVTLLRHTLHLIPFFKCYLHLMKKILKKAVTLWSEGEEKIRVLSFLIILRLMQGQESMMLSFILKKLYMSFIKNCKFTSPQSWPLIIFMRQSLVQLYSLDHVVAYNHAFVFIRQCAITLRNALTTKQKDASKAVYNWQYAHSLMLWVDVLCALHPSETVAPLVFPLVQVMIGSMRLLPVARNFPLRFHFIKSLINLSSATGTFIPILPFIVEVLDLVDVNKSGKSGTKPPQLDCLLKVSKQETSHKEFVEACINKVYELLLDCCSQQSHLISFPELVCTPVVQIKGFLKRCKVPQYSKLVKQAVDKIQENASFIEERRRKKTPQILDREAVNQWEEAVKREGTPLTKFYSKWKKSRLNEEKQQQLESVIEAEEECDTRDDGKAGNKEKKRKRKLKSEQITKKTAKFTRNKAKRSRSNVNEKSLNFEGLELSADESD